MPTPYLNILIFPRSLQFRNRSLGVRRNIVIGNVRASVVLPRANNAQIGAPFSQLLPPRVSNVSYAEKVHGHVHQNDGEGTLRWGGYFSYNIKDPINTAVASVHAAILSISPKQNGQTRSLQAVADECMEHLPAWSSRLTDWIEILTGEDLSAVHPVSATLMPERWTSTAWIHGSGSELDYAFVNPPVVLMGSDGKNAMDEKIWSTAIAAANAGRNIPDVWALIRDARAANLRDNRRRAVLDAATAAELIVDQQLRSELLRNNSLGFVDNLLKGAWQVSRRIEIMKALSMWLPVGLEAKLTSVRNKVVHSNQAVTRAQAEAAVEVAEELARRYAAELLK